MTPHLPSLSIKNNHVRGILSGSAGSFALQIAGGGLGYLLSVYLARSLAAGGFGVYAYVGAWINVLSVFGTLGLMQLTIRETAVAYTEQSWAKLRQYLRFASRFSLGASVSIAIAAAAIGWAAWSSESRNTYLPVFAIALVAMPFSIQTSIRQAALRGCHRIVLSLIPTSLIYPIGLIVLLTAMNLASDHISPAMAMFAHAVSTLSIFLIIALFLRRIVPPPSPGAPSSPFNRDALARPIFSLLAISAIQTVNYHADILMLGAFASPADIGVYTACRRTSDVLALFLVGVDAAVAPRLAAAYARREVTVLQKLAGFSTGLIILLTAPFALFLLIWGQDVLSIFGPRFAAGRDALAILVLGQVVNAFCGPIGSLAIHTKNEAPMSLIVGIAAIINLVLNAALIPGHGVLGAAIASAGSLATWNILLTIYMYRKTRILCIYLPIYKFKPDEQPQRDRKPTATESKSTHET